MKYLYIIVFIACTFVLPSCRGHKSKTIEQEKYEVDPSCVYVCTGSNAQRYHADEYCYGLSNCSGTIETMELYDAEEQGRTPCKLCVDLESLDELE